VARHLRRQPILIHLLTPQSSSLGLAVVVEVQKLLVRLLAVLAAVLGPVARSISGQTQQFILALALEEMVPQLITQMGLLAETLG
jgi:hypothetical protein